jgi:hypothetical protein
MIQYKRVFFLVRHCIRSTPSQVDMCDGTTTTTLHPLPYGVPDWNTPEYFCTAGGLQRITSLGAYLTDKSNEEYELSFDRIVADPIQRDADTAFALAVALGIDTIEYRPEIFHPEVLCPLTNDYTLETVARIEKRLHEVPMPANLEDTLSVLRTKLEGEKHVLMEDGVASNKHTITATKSSIFADANTQVRVRPNSNETCLSGSINAVKLFAQQLFFARASGIGFRTTDFPNPIEYEPWVSYSRNMLFTNTVDAAVRGSILIQHMLHAKQSTIFVGHDSDINALSTVLELNYSLPEYGLTATPPGSGLLVGFTRGGAVEVKYLYPTFRYNDPTNNATNITMTMKWQSLREFRSVQDLSRRLRIQLNDEYGEEVLQCYDRLNNAQALLNGSESQFAWSWHSGPSLVLVLALMAAFVCVVCRQHGRETSQQLHPVRSAVDEVGTITTPTNKNKKRRGIKGENDYGAVLPDLL